jgi:hypothetical protein
VRVWDARVQGTLAAQILWYASAETDPLPQLDRPGVQHVRVRAMKEIRSTKRTLGSATRIYWRLSRCMQRRLSSRDWMIGRTTRGRRGAIGAPPWHGFWRARA